MPTTRVDNRPARDVETATIRGVKSERTGNPVDPPAVDRQRLYKGKGGSIGMLGTAGTQPSVNAKRPSKKRF